ncbi:MAG: FIST N-terminal domain-containing protein [Myxococcota bacterium]
MKLSVKRYHEKQWDGPLPSEMDSSNTLVLVFAAPCYKKDPAAIAEIYANFPNSVVAGCSTAGEIFGSQLSDESISVAIAQFESTRLRSTSFHIAMNEQSFQAGEGLARELLEDDLKAVFILSDGLCVNGSELVRGISSVLPSEIVIGGGLAGDGSAFKETWVLHDKKPSPSYVSIVGFYGQNILVRASSLGGWDVFGPERLVTKSEGNVLYELDGKPALTLYKEYLGERSAELPASALLFPLSLRSEEQGRKGLVRTVLAVDEEKNSMTFAGDIPEGSYAQLMKANFDRLVSGAAGAAEMVSKGASQSSELLAIAISCVGRRLVLGAHTEDETEAVVGVLPPQAKQVGFYSYGEISPTGTGKCDLHNQTMTITTIAEK